MKKLCYLLFIAAFMLIAQSCATIFAGSKTAVSVKGIPDSAKVYYNGMFVGYSPTKVKVPRGKRENSEIEIKKDNYQAEQVKLSSKFSTGYLILDVFSGVWPAVIDLATGSIYAPYPKRIKYNLEPKK